MNEFVIYIDEGKLNFSNFFKDELAKQLLEQLEIRLEFENLLKKYFFALFINSTEIKIQQSDNYAFMEIGILSPDSLLRNITIGWRSKNHENIIDIHSSLIESDEIQFFYFTDLPVEELKNYLIKSQNIKSNIKPNFEYQINYENFPNLVMKIGTNKEFNENEISEINQIIEINHKKFMPSCYVSLFSNNSILFDFQIDSLNFKNNDLELVEKFFNNIIKLISKSKFRNNIEYINVS